MGLQTRQGKRHRKECRSISLLVLFALLLISSCTVSHPTVTDFHALARAGLKLGFDIEEHDDHSLFLESAKWLNVPYKPGGISMEGVDCSGLTCSIYRNVYGKELSRRSQDQYASDCHHKKRAGHLKSGDLVFFTTPNSGKECGHVGIYLKNNLFIHASSNRGVVVESLDGSYWQEHWLAGGSVSK